VILCYDTWHVLGTMLESGNGSGFTGTQGSYSAQCLVTQRCVSIVGRTWQLLQQHSLATTLTCNTHSQDVFKPEPPRLRRHLSAIINFAKFREERAVAYQEMQVRDWGLGRQQLGMPAGSPKRVCGVLECDQLGGAG
jgi:hypothetical protein